MGSLGSAGGKTGKLATYDGPSLKDLVASFDAPLKAPRYTGPGAKPDLQLMTQTWQRAFNQAAAGSTGGTWTINDMVKSVRGLGRGWRVVGQGVEKLAYKFSGEGIMRSCVAGRGDGGWAGEGRAASTVCCGGSTTWSAPAHAECGATMTSGCACGVHGRLLGPASPLPHDHQLQGQLTKMANENSTEPAAGAADADAPAAPASNVTFEEFAGSLVCRQGTKLANCSGVNPCAHKKCMIGSMCMVDMCGSCTAKCVSYAEIGAGLNKVMSTLGLGGEAPVHAYMRACRPSDASRPGARMCACSPIQRRSPPPPPRPVQASRPNCRRPTCRWWTTWSAA